MIKDKLVNAKFYFGISDNLKKGFEWLIKTDLQEISDGRYYIDGDKIFANVQSYDTKDNAPYEAHKDYIDIQYMIKGVEKIGIANIDECSVSEPYNSEKDVEFLDCNICSTLLTLDEGEFMVFFPQDAHQPSLNPDKKLFVKKVIVKVHI